MSCAFQNTLVAAEHTLFNILEGNAVKRLAVSCNELAIVVNHLADSLRVSK